MKKLINKKLTALVLAVITLLTVFTACVKRPDTDSSSQQTVGQSDTPIKIEDGIDLGNGLVITDIGGYTGIYMEDGTDEVVSGVLMLIVTNTGDRTVQYAEITMTAGETQAEFALSTLPVGASVVLLEQNRLEYDKAASYTGLTAKNVAFFQAEPSLMDDKVKLQVLDGVINVTNVSGQDIDGEIVVYYKNSATDLYYGGITYRSRISGGLKAGEIRQLAGGHLSKTGTKVMFVTIG